MGEAQAEAPLIPGASMCYVLPERCSSKLRRPSSRVVATIMNFNGDLAGVKPKSLYLSTKEP